MNKKRIYAIILLPLIMPLFMIGFLSVGLLSAQVETSILTMQGKDWSVEMTLLGPILYFALTILYTLGIITKIGGSDE